MTHKGTWKKFEAQVASFFGARRTVGSGSLGIPDRTKSDSNHPDLYIECKYKKDYPIIRHFRELRKPWKKTPFCLWLQLPQKKDLFLMIESELLDVFMFDVMAPTEFASHLMERKRLDVTTLHIENEEKAEQEGKLAVTCIKMKGLHGWYVVVRESDIDRLKDIME